MKYYLIFILFVIMGAGARAMFEIAYLGLAVEHDAAPNALTYLYIFIAVWYVLMMIADILLITGKNLKFKSALAALLTAGVLGPIVYMITNSK